MCFVVDLKRAKRNRQEVEILQRVRFAVYLAVILIWLNLSILGLYNGCEIKF
jgi:hypothetical protein